MNYTTLWSQRVQEQRAWNSIRAMPAAGRAGPGVGGTACLPLMKKGGENALSLREKQGSGGRGNKFVQIDMFERNLFHS